MGTGRYFTRSSASTLEDNNTNDIKSDSSTRSRQPDMSCSRPRRKASSCTSSSINLPLVPVPCPCKMQKILKYTKILIATCLFVSVIWYITDNNYNSFLRELNKLRGHINSVEKIVQKVSIKKCDADKQLEEIAKSLPVLKGMANELKDDIKKCGGGGGKSTSTGPDEILRRFIKAEIEEYDADKTDKIDFALESSGGMIVSTRDTESFSSGTSLSIFGIPLCVPCNKPSALIQPGVMPGECWAFKGSKGNALIKLIAKITVTGVSLEHIPRSISPTGKIDTAPRQFSIWGLRCEKETDGFFFGQFQYCTEGTHVQYFPVKYKSSRTFDLIEFRVLSNYGHPDYTCVYRLRVHGEIKRDACPTSCNPNYQKEVNKCS